MSGPRAPLDGGATLTTVETEYEQALEQADAVLDEVDAALRRLSDGSYGVCTTCGGPVSDERLAVTPTALTCELHAG
jgi:DnaK suppressor protein